MVLDHHIGLVRLGLFSGNGPVRLVLVLSIGPCLECLLFLVCDIEPYIEPVRLVLVSGICHSIGLFVVGAIGSVRLVLVGAIGPVRLAVELAVLDPMQKFSGKI